MATTIYKDYGTPFPRTPIGSGILLHEPFDAAVKAGSINQGMNPSVPLPKDQRLRLPVTITDTKDGCSPLYVYADIYIALNLQSKTILTFYYAYLVGL